MKIVIVGPGSIGCLFTVFFINAGHDVYLLDKNPIRAESISQTGIRIDDKNGSRVIKAIVTADTGSLPAADLLYICVKSYDTLSAIQKAIPLIKPETIIISLQNGAGNAEQIIAESAADSRVMCGITAHGVTMLEDGHIRHAGYGPTHIAPFSPQYLDQAEQTADIMTQAGIETRISHDAQSMIWSKLIINASINPLTAIANIANGRLLLDTTLRSTMHNIALEADSVAKAKGINLVYDDVIKAVEDVCKNTSDNFSSMLQDIRRKRRTEIDSITGVIVSEGKKAGVPTPANEILLKQIKQMS